MKPNVMQQDEIQPAAHADPQGEAFSCLIDGELDQQHGDRLLDHLCRDAQARLQWSRLNAACDAMRSSEVACWHSDSFAARVSAALDAEPTVLAPLASRRRVRRVVIPGVAMAAAAALLVIVAVPQLRGGSESTPQLAVVPDASIKTTGATAAVVAPTALPSDEAEVARSPQLEAYLDAHREMAGSGVMPGPTLYMRTTGQFVETPASR